MQLRTAQVNNVLPFGIMTPSAKLALDQHLVVLNVLKGRVKDGERHPSSGRFYYCFETNLLTPVH